MEKTTKIIKFVSITLIVLVLCMVAFLGVFTKENSIWGNKISNWNYGIEVNGAREIHYVLDTSEEDKKVYIDSEGNIKGEVIEDTSIELTEENSEESTSEEETEANSELAAYTQETRTIKANEDEVKTKSYYKKAKKIIQKRLDENDVYEYNVRLDELTGELVIEVEDDSDTVTIVNSIVTTLGKIKIVDSQTGLVLIDSSNIKNVQSGTYQSDTGYQACLQVYFDKEGTEKLKEISNKYVATTDENGESTTEYVSVYIDDSGILKTYFGSELAGGVIQIPVGDVTTDSETLRQTLIELRTIASCANNQVPVAYSISSDDYVKSNISDSVINIIRIIIAVIVVVISALLIIKFKSKGYMAAVLSIGFIAIFDFISKYTTTVINTNALIAFLSVIALNYIFIYRYLSNNEGNIKENFANACKKYYLNIIPVGIIAILFTFVSNVVVGSIGMILFLGLLIQAIYNLIVILACKLV